MKIQLNGPYVTILLLIATLFCSSVLPGRAWAEAAQMVASDGFVSLALADEASVAGTGDGGRVDGFDGTGRASAATLFDLGVTREYSWNNGRLPDDILEVEKNAVPAMPPGWEWAAAESTLGNDGSQRLFARVYPARAVVYITFTTAGGLSRCTGWLIGWDTVMTAGHCVHPGFAAGDWYTNYTIYPGRDGAVAPYGSCGAVRLYSTTLWTDGGNWEYDYGAIKLDCNIGRTVGWFGWRWKPGNLGLQPTILQGYPAGKPGTWRQWTSTDKNRCNHVRKVFYLADTAGGESGGPIWNNTIGNGIHALGIHAYGAAVNPCGRLTNSGTRITQAVSDMMKIWRADPK